MTHIDKNINSWEGEIVNIKVNLLIILPFPKWLLLLLITHPFTESEGETCHVASFSLLLVFIFFSSVLFFFSFSLSSHFSIPLSKSGFNRGKKMHFFLEMYFFLIFSTIVFCHMSKMFDQLWQLWTSFRIKFYIH